MVAALIGSIAVASLVSLLLSRSLLGPIRAVTQGARSLAAGDLDQVVPATTRDELGELATAFNAMARTIREFRQAGTERLVRAQRTAQATIDSFPDPVVVVDTTGAVERANPAARRLLHLPMPGGSTPWEPPSTLRPALAEVLGGRPDHLPTGLEHAVCLRDDGQERFYLPRVLAIRGESNGAPRRGGRAPGRDETPPRRPAQERHGLDREPRVEDAPDRASDGRPSAPGRGDRPAQPRSSSNCSWRPARIRTGCCRWSTICST